MSLETLLLLIVAFVGLVIDLVDIAVHVRTFRARAKKQEINPEWFQ